MKHFDGRINEIQNDNIIKFDTKLVNGEGMPILNDTNHGDLIIKFKIIFLKSYQMKEKLLDKI